jgi:2-alkyl-3-oxoalkanoate reductase
MTVSVPRKLRVAVVGAGYVATHHLAALSRLDFVELVGLCDSNTAAAEDLAERFTPPKRARPKIAATLGELADTSPNVVYVLTPPASHAALAIQAMDMGCHVLVEKPMADSAADCEAMLAKAQATGLTLGVNHSDLFDPVLMRALDAANNGDIGEVLSVDIVRNSEYPPYAGGPLPGQVKQGSYPFRDLGVHGFYTIEAFLGPIAQAEVRFQSRGGDPNLGFDEWQAQAQTARGVGRLLLSWNARPMENRLFVRGTRGTIEVDRFTQVCRIHRTLPGPKFIGILLNAFFSAAKDVFRIPINVLRFATGQLKPSPGIRCASNPIACACSDSKPATSTCRRPMRWSPAPPVSSAARWSPRCAPGARPCACWCVARSPRIATTTASRPSSAISATRGSSITRWPAPASSITSAPRCAVARAISRPARSGARATCSMHAGSTAAREWSTSVR